MKRGLPWRGAIAAGHAEAQTREEAAQWAEAAAVEARERAFRTQVTGKLAPEGNSRIIAVAPGRLGDMATVSGPR